MINYSFKRLEELNEKAVLCPRCREPLFRIDIENYSLCPYCAFSLEMTDELEDFLLEPIVEGWTATEQKRMM